MSFYDNLVRLLKKPHEDLDQDLEEVLVGRPSGDHDETNQSPERPFHEDLEDIVDLARCPCMRTFVGCSSEVSLHISCTIFFPR